MKKRFVTLFILCVLLTGCNLKDILPGKKNVVEDNRLIIQLSSNSSTGYSWNYSMDNNIISIDSQYTSNCEDGVDGCGGYENFIVTATKSGSTKLVFIYARGEKVAKKITYNLIVSEDLKISESHIEEYLE